MGAVAGQSERQGCRGSRKAGVDNEPFDQLKWLTRKPNHGSAQEESQCMTTRDSRWENIEKPEAILLSVIGKIGHLFPDDTANNVTELATHSEPGIALETLCTQIDEHQLSIDADTFNDIMQVAILIGLYPAELETIKASLVRAIPWLGKPRPPP
jgi:hypothetical protein